MRVDVCLSFRLFSAQVSVYMDCSMNLQRAGNVDIFPNILER